MHRFVMFLAALLLMVSPAEAERRLALVIGNDSYHEVAPLKKAVSDAKSMAEKLTNLGFEVTAITDAGRRDMNLQIEQFASEIEAGDVALLFYAGHGIEVGGENLLLPVDVPKAGLGQEGFLKAESIQLSELLDRVKSRGARVSLAIIDACRDNPFALENKRSLGRTRGLGRISAPEGTFVIFSAGAGQSALDRLSEHDENPNSIFTRALIPLLERPGLGLRALAVELRRDVRRLAMTIAHPQTPAYYDELIGDFAFVPELEGPWIQAPGPEEDPGLIRGDFQLVKEIGTDDAWRAFLARHGHRTDDFHVVLARSALSQIMTGQEPEIAEQDGEVEIPPVSDCDWLAAHPDDPDAATEGVYIDDLAPSEAIAACRMATDRYPAAARFAFQLGRALHKHGDYDAAQLWYGRAVDLGYPMAMNNIGYLYRDGQGVEQDYVEALRWHGMAADRGLPIAMHEIAHMHAGGLGVTQDYTSAMEWYRRAADAGHPWSIYSIGNLYQEGHGVPRDHAEALKWFRKAAELGVPSAMNRVGYYFAKGLGAEQDFDAAMQWFQRGVDAGDPWAIKNMGELFERGQGVPKDAGEAAKWYATALSTGHRYTRERLIHQPEKFEEGTRRNLQRMLREGGFYDGAIDGEFGPATVAALEMFYDEAAKPGGN